MKNKKIKNKKIIAGLVGILVLVGSLQALDITTSVENAVTYIKTIFLTTDGKPTSDKKIIIEGSDGSITMSGALNIQEGAIKDNTIVSKDIKDNTIEGVDFKDDSITSNKIKDGEVKTSDLADDSVTSEKIKDGEITSEDIATGAVDNNILADNSVDNRVLKNTDNFDMSGLNVVNNLIVSGNIGIGITNPTARLDVNGEIKARNGYGDIIGLGGDNYENDSHINLYAPEERNNIVFWNRTLGERANIEAKQARFQSGVYTRGADLDYKTIEWQDIEFGHVDGSGNIVSRDMIINKDGNVGIGTTDPQATFRKSV